MGSRRFAPIATVAQRKDHTMNTNRIEGAAKEVAGSIKEVVGKVTGDRKLRVRGAVEKSLGSAQVAIGKAQDKLGVALKK